MEAEMPRGGAALLLLGGIMLTPFARVACSVVRCFRHEAVALPPLCVVQYTALSMVYMIRNKFEIIAV